MKRIISRLIIASTIIVFLLVVGGIIFKIIKTRESANRIKTLPSFSLRTLEGDIFNSDDVQRGPLLIIYFHPECEHCQYEISSLIESDIFSKDIVVLLVSNAGLESIKTFMKQFNIHYNKFRILSDTALIFNEIFGINAVPSNLIYNEDLKLVKFLKGEVSTNAILNYLDSGN